MANMGCCLKECTVLLLWMQTNCLMHLQVCNKQQTTMLQHCAQTINITNGALQTLVSCM